MKFKDAYIKMLEGDKIQRPGFKGYWFIDSVSGKLIIKLANGNEIKEGDLSLTVQNTLAEDWFVMSDTDCCADLCKYVPEINGKVNTPNNDYEYIVTPDSCADDLKHFYTSHNTSETKKESKKTKTYLKG